MSKVLEIGEYTLKDGVTLERTGKFVTVRQIEGYDNKPRCNECKHFGNGRATRCGYMTTICLLQPKGVIDKDGKKLYYHIGARRLACEKFESNINMSKAEKFIEENTRNCSNELCAVEDRFGKKVISYHEWLTPDQAKEAVEIAREEMYEWLEEHSQEYVYWMDEEFGKDDLINDLKQAMKDE